MMDSKGILDDAMLNFRKRGIHSIVVNSYTQARNFILYHVGSGTLINIDKSKEVEELNLKRSVDESGGTIVYGFENKDIKFKGGRKLIDNVEVHGSKYIFENIERLLCGTEVWEEFSYKKKIIVIVPIHMGEDEETIRKLYDRICEIEKRNSTMFLVSEDVSIIFVRTNI